MLRSLPYVHTASEIQDMRFWRATVRESNRIADPVKRAKNQTSRLINQQLGKLSSITRQASLQFPALRTLAPFERVRKQLEHKQQGQGSRFSRVCCHYRTWCC